MNKVTVLKAELLSVIERNMDSHRDIYEAAMVGYERAAIEWLEGMLAQIRNGDTETRLIFTAPMPEDHTDDYERVRLMIQWSTSDEIELSAGEFEQYVMDNWGWKRQWAATNSSYLT